MIRWLPGYWLYTVWYYFALYFILHRHILVNAYGNRRLHKNTHTYTDTPMCVYVSMVYTCTHHGGTRTHHIFAYIVYICATDQLEKKKLFTLPSAKASECRSLTATEHIPKRAEHSTYLIPENLGHLTSEKCSTFELCE